MTVSFPFGLLLSSQNVPFCHECNMREHLGSPIKMTQIKVTGNTRDSCPYHVPNIGVSTPYP